MIVCETVIGELEVIWYSLKEEAQDTVCKFSFLIFVLDKTVNDVHLEVE